MNPETWKLVASIGGVLITVVTGPMIWAMRAEAGKIRTEMQLLRTELKLEMEKQKNELKGDIAGVKTELKETETRLNQRIDTRLVHR